MGMSSKLIGKGCPTDFNKILPSQYTLLLKENINRT